MRIAILSFFIALIFITQVSGIETDLKTSYQPQETMIIKVSGSIVGTISSDQIFFKRNNIFVPVEYDVARVGSDWYIWAVVPSTENNYTLILENVEVYGGQTENYQKSFAVAGNVTSYNIKPGFIISNNNFNIELTVNDNTNHEIEIDFPSSQTLTVQPGTNTIGFSVDSSKSMQFVMIKVGDYFVPAFVPYGTSSQANQTTEQNQTNSTSQSNQSAVIVISPKISVSPPYVQQFIYQNNQERIYTFTLQNENNLSYKNLQITFNDSLFDTEDSKFNLKANENYTFSIILNENNQRNIKEIIYINGTNVSIEIPFILRLSDNATAVAAFYGELTTNTSTNTTTRKTSYLCSELGGIVCSAGNTCSGENLEGKDGACCLGVCKQPEGKSYAWLGWVLAFVVLGVGWFAYYKYKKAGTE